MHKNVILYSGGMDSFILAALYPDAFKLYVDVGSKYTNKEILHLPVNVNVDRSIDLGPWERPDAIIPARNMFLALVAAQYGEHIMLGATAGDLSTDKDEKWAGLATDVIRYMFSGKHFDPAPDMQILLPLKDRTKADLVAAYKKIPLWDQLALVNTISCYDPDHLHCGQCKSCLRKWIALEHNRIPSGAIWSSKPQDAPAWSGIIRSLKSADGWRSKREDMQTIAVLRDHDMIQGVA